VYGDVDLRARMVIKLLRLRNHPELPVMVGPANPCWAFVPYSDQGTKGLACLNLRMKRSSRTASTQ
jgi:hypothetical protein